MELATARVAFSRRTPWCCRNSLSRKQFG